jgi:hypothetical protein
LTQVVGVILELIKYVKRNGCPFIGTTCDQLVPPIYLFAIGRLAQLVVVKIAHPDAKTVEIDIPFNKLRINLRLIIDMSLSEYLLFLKLFLDLQHQ